MTKRKRAEREAAILKQREEEALKIARNASRNVHSSILNCLQRMHPPMMTAPTTAKKKTRNQQADQ